MATPPSKDIKLASPSNASENVDLISRMPDSILCKVLGLLPADEAVRTSVLSTKWRYIWALNSTLQLVMPQCRNRVEAQRFMEFVDNIMARRNGVEFHKFRFHGFTNFEHDRVNQLICTVAECGVQVLDIHKVCGPRSKAIKLPPSILGKYSMLVELKLSDNVLLDVPSDISLPSLKTLELKSVTYVDEDSLKNLLAGCAAVEELLVERCLRVSSDNIETFNVSMASLKRLTLFFGLQSHPCHGNDCKFSLVIDTPNLEYLSLSDHMSGNFLINCTLSNLVEAYLDVKNECRANNVREYQPRVLGLVTHISLAKSLTLSGLLLNSLGVDVDGDFPWFLNMETLTVGVDTENGFTLLPELLDSMPHLKALVFSDGLGYWGVTEKLEYVFKCTFPPPIQTPTCLRASLKTIKIHGLSVGSKEEVNMVRYLLMKSEVLSTMTITGFKADRKIRRLLLVSPRGSPACQLTIS